MTRDLTEDEIMTDYEPNTGLVISETFQEGGISPLSVPGVLVASHGPFTWGKSAREAVKHSIVFETLSRMECTLRSMAPDARPPSPTLVDKHFLWKHGSGAYYGQG